MKKIACLMAFCSFLLTGCWDQKELNQMAVVMGVGLDKAGAHEYRLTAQVIKPNPSSGKGGSGGSELPTWSLSANGKTVMEAIQRLNQISPRRLYWAHMQIIIFGEELAKEGIKPVITWFERDRDGRSGTYVAVTKGKAEDLLNKKIQLGNVPARAMSDFLDTAELRQIPARKLKLRDLVSALTTAGSDPSMDVLDPKTIRGKVETYQLTGLAVFSDDKLKGYVDLPYTVGPAIVFKKFSNTVLTVPIPGLENQYLSYTVTDFQQQMKPVVKGDNVDVEMKIFVEGNLNDQTDKKDVTDPQVKKEVIQEIEKQMKDYIIKSFKQAAEMNSDIYGIGKDVRRFYPVYWHEHEHEWIKRLKDVTFTINIDAYIRRSGLNYQPTPNKIK